jgi:hypothetical protein
LKSRRDELSLAVLGGYISGILHGAKIDDSRLDACAASLGGARVEKTQLFPWWTLTVGDLTLTVAASSPSSSSDFVLKTPMRSEDEALDADWAAFDPILRALCLATEPTHAYALLFVDDDSQPKPASPSELRWHSLAPEEWPAVLPARAYFGAALRAIAPAALTTRAALLGAGLYVSDATPPDAEALAAAFGDRMRPIGGRLAVLRPLA